jgi:REP element-mobilizing transposase RayT
MYHVTARGNHRQDIFFQHKDRQLLDDIMADALDRTGARIHAYCWMTNHVHLLTQVGDQPLGRLMQRVGTRFSRAIQRNLSTTGHLFENRYHAVLVDVDSYFLELLRYIHLNPVRARIVETPQQYRWSSHRVYLAKTTQPWVHVDFGLSLFSKDPERARVLYEAFINDAAAPSRDPMEDVHPKERRVLGDDRFLQKLPLHSTKRPFGTTLESIAISVCYEAGLSLDAVRSPSRARHLNHARAGIAHRAITQNIATLSQVARYLNRTASALSYAVTRYRTTASK